MIGYSIGTTIKMVYIEFELWAMCSLMHVIYSILLIMRYEPCIIIIPRSKMRELEPGRLHNGPRQMVGWTFRLHALLSHLLLYIATPSNLCNLPILHLTLHHQYLLYNLAFKEYLNLSNLNHLRIQKIATKKGKENTNKECLIHLLLLRT